MDEKFLAALRNIGTGDSATIVERVSRLFSTINRLEPSEAIAAYQTFKFFCLGRIVDDAAVRNKIDAIREALIVRMQALCATAPREERKAVALVFTGALGSTRLHMWRFEKIIAS